MSQAVSESATLPSGDIPVPTGVGTCEDIDVPHLEDGERLSPSQNEIVAALQRQVTDLTKKLEKMEHLVSRINIEKPPKNNQGTKLKEGGASNKAEKAQETVAGAKEDEKELGSLAECKILHVKPGISWRHKVKEIAAGKLKKYAMLVCYEETKTADLLGIGTFPGAIPINIIINSVRLDQLLQGFSQNLLPEASHVPYIASSPFKAFVSLYDKFKSGLGYMEDMWDEKPEATTDASNNDTSENDSFKSQQEEIMLLRCFVKMCEEHLGAFLKLQSQVADGTLEKISYQNLWYLFRPGDIIVGRGEEDPRNPAEAYCVYCPTSSAPPKELLSVTWDLAWYQRHDKVIPQHLKDDLPQQDDFHLFSYQWRWNGSRLVPHQRLVSIRPFKGEKHISELAYFPKRFCKGDDPILETLILKGETFRRLRYGHGLYRGLNVQPQSPQFVDEEVFIDFASGYEANDHSIASYMEQSSLSLPFIEQEEVYEQHCDKVHCWTCDINMPVSKLEMKRASDFRATGKHALTLSPEDFSSLSEDQIVRLPHILVGYGLKSKDWYLLDIDKFETIPKTQQSFDHLVIPSKQKDFLKSLVRDDGIMSNFKHEIEAKLKTEIDIVKGKGNGVVILLYGPPGVGKTSTAETIAASSDPDRPLYAIACGDLGSEAVEIQRNLDRHFKLARRWNCILLLDEADVYLAERNIHDPGRNRIVSVFLRYLEYYPGILFLTSNREGLIDEGFKSRIHVALRYKAIDEAQTMKIWHTILDRIEMDNVNKAVKVCFDRYELVEWAESHFHNIKDSKSDGLNTATWNGRQIRNAFQTAIAVASYERIKYLKSKNVTEKEALSKKDKKYRTITLRSKHFGTVSKVVGEFEDYLAKCRGDDADRASKSSWRKDNHEPGAPRVSAYPTTKERIERFEGIDMSEHGWEGESTSEDE